MIWYYMILLYIYMYTYLLYMAINVCYGLQNLDQLVIPVSWSLGRRRPRTSQGTAGAACAASKAREDVVFGTGGQKRRWTQSQKPSPATKPFGGHEIHHPSYYRVIPNFRNPPGLWRKSMDSKHPPEMPWSLWSFNWKPYDFIWFSGKIMGQQKSRSKKP